MQERSATSPGWRTAKSCAAGNCVQVATRDGLVLIGDTKNPGGPILTYSGAEWKEFLAGAKNGDFDDLT